MEHGKVYHRMSMAELPSDGRYCGQRCHRMGQYDNVDIGWACCLQSLLEWSLGRLPGCYPIFIKFGVGLTRNSAQSYRSFFTTLPNINISFSPARLVSRLRAQDPVTAPPHTPLCCTDTAAADVLSEACTRLVGVGWW